MVEGGPQFRRGLRGFLLWQAGSGVLLTALLIVLIIGAFAAVDEGTRLFLILLSLLCSPVCLHWLLSGVQLEQNTLKVGSPIRRWEAHRSQVTWVEEGDVVVPRGTMRGVVVTLDEGGQEKSRGLGPSTGISAARREDWVLLLMQWAKDAPT